MKIGFDLDKIFIDYPPLVPDRLIDRLYRKKANGVLLYRIPSRPEQAVRRLSHLSYLRPPIQKNISFLKTLRHDNHHLYLISSRFRFLETATLALMKKHQFDSLFDGMYFNFEDKQPHVFKNEILKKLRLSCYVDDDLALLEYLSLENKKTKLFWLRSKKTSLIPPSPIVHISDLSCILE